MISWKIFASVSDAPSSPLSSHWIHYSLSRSRLKSAATLKIPYLSLGFEDLPTGPLELSKLKPKNDEKGPSIVKEVGLKRKDIEPGGQGCKRISGIEVPRQRYIAISKSELLDAIVLMLDSQEEIDQFLLLSSCLDSIIHAEHKSILEEMRVDYNLTQSMQNKGNNHKVSDSSKIKSAPNGKESDLSIDNAIGIGSMDNYGEGKTEPNKPMPSIYGLDLRYFFSSLPKNVNRHSLKVSRVAVATRFQRAFMQLLYNAQFEELSARDLMLTSALNSDYLLTLPIYVDWKRAFESNAIIFRRGYATERQKGLLIVEKLDYLQSKFLQGLFFFISKPLEKVGAWINETFKSTSQGQNAQVWTKRIIIWLKELPIFRQSYTFSEQIPDNLLGVDQLSDGDLPIWLAAQRAVTRYEGILSPVGPRGRLLRKLFTWIGLIPSLPNKTFELDSNATPSEPYLRPIFLSRISLSDIWEPATRKFCGNDPWKMLKTSVSILLSQAILQEPAFQELILLYTKEMGDGDTEDKDEFPSLQLKIYERISIPDLPVIFPHKKLSFRILDTVRLDVATILGLLAYFINYKFEDILLSPSSIFLDVIAISALIIYVTRVALGYKQTWDRYQLLVNRTLYERTLASGFGSVHFLLDASEQQQYKEAILAYAILLKAENGQVTCSKSVGAKCERFLYDVFKEKVEMPVDKAMDTLVRLGLVIEIAVDGKIGLQAIPCPKAYEVLKQRWNSLLN